MRTDPRTACANAEERVWWAIVHDLIAHPLMALTLWHPLLVRFHDWTSTHAWPRASTRERFVHRTWSDVLQQSVLFERIDTHTWKATTSLRTYRFIALDLYDAWWEAETEWAKQKAFVESR